MKVYAYILLAISLLCTSCTSTNADNTIPVNSNKVFILKVDFNTNLFEGGKELSFASNTSSMTINHQYNEPSDAGGIKLFYAELNNQLLFDGSIIWAGLGEVNYPQNFVAANEFNHVITTDFVTPSAGFENVFNPHNINFDYLPVWSAVQGLVKVRQFLSSNPNATVKLFLYTPSVGVGDPADWDWYIFLKK